MPLKPSSPLPTSFVSLSGYGVELAVKSTEYKALDDLASANNKIDGDEHNRFLILNIFITHL